MMQDILTYLPEHYYSIPVIAEMILRIFISGVIGIIIGYDSLKRRKGVGPGTHAMIAITSALIMVLSKYAFMDVGHVEYIGKVADSARLAAAVISGVSFLCASAIFKADGNIRGLTTAAGMWATSGVGLAIGSGMYIIGIVFTIGVLSMKKFASYYKSRPNFRIRELHIIIKDSPELYKEMIDLIKSRGNKIEHSSLRREGDKLFIKLNVSGGEKLPDEEEFNRMILENKDIFEIEIFNN